MMLRLIYYVNKIGKPSFVLHVVKAQMNCVQIQIKNDLIEMLGQIEKINSLYKHT